MKYEHLLTQNCFCLVHYEGQNYCKSTQIETVF